MDFWNVLQHFELLSIDLFSLLMLRMIPSIIKLIVTFCLPFKIILNRELSHWFFFSPLRRFAALYFAVAGGFRFFTIVGGILFCVGRG